MTHKHFKIILVTLLCLCGKEISAKKIERQNILLNIFGKRSVVGQLFIINDTEQ